MTNEEAAWLKLLRNTGPQPIRVLFGQYPNAVRCLETGWTEWSGRLDEPERITAAGRAALAAYEASEAVNGARMARSTTPDETK